MVCDEQVNHDVVVGTPEAAHNDRTSLEQVDDDIIAGTSEAARDDGAGIEQVDDDIIVGLPEADLDDGASDDMRTITVEYTYAEGVSHTAT